MTRWRPHGAFLAALICSWLSACARCQQDERPAIATLTTVVGEGVTRDFASAPRSWVAAELGARLALGDAARTDAKSTAELTFVDGAHLELRPGTVVRLLLDEGDTATGVDVQAGEAQLRSSHRGLTLRTHLGLATIAPDSQITLRREGQELGLRVALGSVSFREADAGELGLRAGDDVRVGIGMAVFGLKRAATADAAHDLTLEVVSGQASLTHSGVSTRAAAPGTQAVQQGTQLKLGAGDEVLVTRGTQRARLRGPGEFVLGLERALAESRRGRVNFEQVESDVEIRVPGGSIIARALPEGAVADLAVGPDENHVTVTRGVVTADLLGQQQDVRAGEERAFAQRSETAQAERGPSFKNFAAPIGESFIVHTPSAPVAVGFSFANKCGGEGQLELVGTRQVARGKGSANLSFAPGVRAYTLRCLSEQGAPGRIVARGSVQVVIDPGTRKLPPRAPTSRVETDGRTYTIYYQNQLPEVSVRWPNAPDVAEYTLELDGKPIALKAPEHQFASGALRDGSHRLVFRAQGRQSRTTTVEVRFDNAAPKASLSEPADRGFAAGDLVPIEGVALPTWKVALQSGTIAMNPGERFTGQVQTSPEQPDIAVRISHPRLGTHYYLRRASGSP